MPLFGPPSGFPHGKRVCGDGSAQAVNTVCSLIRALEREEKSLPQLMRIVWLPSSRRRGPAGHPSGNSPRVSKPILFPASTPVTLFRHTHAQTPHFSCCFHLPLFFLTKTTYIKMFQGTGACRVRRCREVPKTSYSHSCQHHLSPLLIT